MEKRRRKWPEKGTRVARVKMGPWSFGPRVCDCFYCAPGKRYLMQGAEAMLLPCTPGFQKRGACSILTKNPIETVEVRAIPGLRIETWGTHIFYLFGPGPPANRRQGRCQEPQNDPDPVPESEPEPDPNLLQQALDYASANPGKVALGAGVIIVGGVAIALSGGAAAPVLLLAF